MGNKIFEGPLTKPTMEVEDRLQMLLFWFIKTVREIISSVMPGNICSESHKNHIFFFSEAMQTLTEFKLLKTDSSYINVNFTFLSQSTVKLEKTTNSLSKMIKEINDIQDKLNRSNCSEADAAKRNPFIFQYE